MILIYLDNKENWHLVSSMAKTGIASITITGHCGETGTGEGIRQVHDKYLSRVCGKCQAEVEKL